MTTQLKLKKSSVIGRVPQASDLDYGELAINYADGIIYYKNSSNQVKSFIDSDLIVSSITGTVDSAYISNLITNTGLDSAAVIGIVDSDYVIARQQIDSAFIISEVNTYVDSDYIGQLLGTIDKLDEITTNDSTTYQLLLNTVSYSPPNATSILVSVNGIIQEAGDAYTVNSDTITFAQPLSSDSDVVDFILTIGKPYATTEHITELVNQIVDSDFVANIIGQPKLLDTITTADSTTYSLAYSSTPYIPLSDAALLVSVNGIIQEAGVAYTVDSDKITFAQSLSGDSDTVDFILSLAFPYTVPNILDGSVTPAKFSSAITVYDSSHVTSIVDSAYVQSIQVDLQRDSAFITNIIDSDYINLRVSGVDSASVLSIIDSDYLYDTLTGGTGVTVNTVANEISIGQSVGVGDTVTFNGVTVNSGGLLVNSSIDVATGGSRTITSDTLNIRDAIDGITLNTSLDSTASPTSDISIKFNRGISPSVSIRWDEDSDKWLLQNGLGNYFEILTRENEGTSPAAGGINADKLDSQEGSYYLNYNNFTNTPTSITSFGITDGVSGQVLQTDGNGNFTFETVSGGGGGGSAVGYAGFEDYYYNVTGSSTTTFNTTSATHTKVQVFRNGVLVDDGEFSFTESTGIVTLSTAADSGDEVTIWGFNNNNLGSVDSDGNLTVAGTARIGNHSLHGSLTSTLTTTTPTNILLYGTDSYMGAKLVVTVKNAVTNHTQISESLILTVDSGGTGGGEPLITTYGTIYTDSSALATFDVTKSAQDSDTRLQVTMSSSDSCIVKVAYNLITV